MRRTKIELAKKEQLNKILFTEHFGIKAKQEELDFIDIYVNADKKLFLDPARLLRYDDALSVEMSNHIVEYFNQLLCFIRKKDRINGLKMLRYLKEPREIHLGYAVDGYQGNAIGGIKGTHIYNKFSQSKAVQTGMLKDLEESALLVKGVDRDVISDMSAMICKRELIAFTQTQCRKHNVPMKKVKIGRIWTGGNNWPYAEAELPVYQNKPMILVPKNFVTDIMTLDSQDFYRNEILSSIQENLMRADESLIIVLKNGNRRCAVTKKELKVNDQYRFSKDLIYEIVQDKPEILRQYRHRKKYMNSDIDEKLNAI